MTRSTIALAAFFTAAFSASLYAQPEPGWTLNAQGDTTTARHVLITVPPSPANSHSQLTLTGASSQILFGNGQYLQDGNWGNLQVFGAANLNMFADGPISLNPASGSGVIIGRQFVPSNPSNPLARLEVFLPGTAETITPALTFADALTGTSTRNAGVALRYVTNSGSAVAEMQMRTGAGVNNDTQFIFRTQAVSGGLADRMIIAPNGKVGIGVPVPTANLHVAGSIQADTVIGATYQDLAEWVPAAEAIEPGTVVVLDRTQNNHVIPSARAYDTAVAGVISAQPGVILGTTGPSKVMVATTGRVKVHVDASTSPVAVGDLLATSGKAGMAMKSEPVDIAGVSMHRPGTLIGKALEPLAGGEGEILVLLSLQ